MRRILVLLAVVALVFLALPAATATAAPPPGLEIGVEECLEAPGTFVASGPAVDDGLVCATGTTSETTVKKTPNKKWGFNLQVFQLFTCGDGSGTFLMKLQVKVFFKGSPPDHLPLEGRRRHW